MNFRNIPKKFLRTWIPREVAVRIAVLAAEQGRPSNEVVTEFLCAGLGLDPASYGIHPDRREGLLLEAR